MVGRKKKMMAAKAQATIARKHPSGLTHQERRAQKLERRKKEKKSYTANDWAVPAPSHLVAKLDLPKVKSKYQSYFEFADNPEKKEKKLEFTVGAFLVAPFMTTNPYYRSSMMPNLPQASFSFPSEIRS